MADEMIHIFILKLQRLIGFVQFQASSHATRLVTLRHLDLSVFNRMPAQNFSELNRNKNQFAGGIRESDLTEIHAAGIKFCPAHVSRKNLFHFFFPMVITGTYLL